MTKNLADQQGRCYWWYHGLISKDEVYKILYDDVKSGKTKPVNRSFCVRFRLTESQSMSIQHYRLEHDGPKWKERFIIRTKTGYRLEDHASNGQLLECLERPTVAAIVDELSNPLTRGDRVILVHWNPKKYLLSEYHPQS